MKTEGSDGLGGAVVDQTLPVLEGYRDCVDRHALVLQRLPPSFYQAVQQDAEEDEDSCSQDGSYSENTCKINFNTFIKVNLEVGHSEQESN